MRVIPSHTFTTPQSTTRTTQESNVTFTTHHHVRTQNRECEMSAQNLLLKREQARTNSTTRNTETGAAVPVASHGGLHEHVTHRVCEKVSSETTHDARPRPPARNTARFRADFFEKPTEQRDQDHFVAVFRVVSDSGSGRCSVDSTDPFAKPTTARQAKHHGFVRMVLSFHSCGRSKKSICLHAFCRAPPVRDLKSP